MRTTAIRSLTEFGQAYRLTSLLPLNFPLPPNLIKRIPIPLGVIACAGSQSRKPSLLMVKSLPLRNGKNSRHARRATNVSHTKYEDSRKYDTKKRFVNTARTRSALLYIHTMV